MAKSKAKKQGTSRKKTGARAKAARPAAGKAKPAGSGSDDSSDSLRAIAKSFAARMLR